MTLDMDTLNKNQRTAVEWNEGSLLVLAGPGSGKTRVLTMRVAKLITDSPGKRFRVLGLTFTNKAAAEMRTRVEQMVPEGRERILLTTFHSFCADILRQHGSHVGISPDYNILNQDADRESVLTDAISALKTGAEGNEERNEKILPIIDRLLSECVPDDAVVSYLRDKNLDERVAKVYKEYQNQLIRNNHLDFPSLLHLTLRLLANNPVIVKQLRTVYPHICVDEFQDTNLAQYQILRLVAGDNPQNLFVVADDDQIIYQWNGASPERLKALRDDYLMGTIQLPANYRCPPQVITLANQLIKFNLDRAADKVPLYAMKEASCDNVVLLHQEQSLDDELEWVAMDIATKHSSATGDCVILARTRKVLEQAVLHLAVAGIKGSLTIRKSEFTSAPLRYLHSLLRLANSRSDRDQLRRLCKAFYEVEGVDIGVQEVASDADGVGGDLLRAWFHSARSRSEPMTVTSKMLDSGYRLIVERLDFLGFITIAFEWITQQQVKLAGQNLEGYTDYIEEKTAWDELQTATLEKFGRDELTLNTMLQEFDLSEKSSPVPPDAVKCLTIHVAKGMEFKHVYLVGLAEDQLPSFQSIKKGDASREMQEERRNCFVAITRTQATLTLSFANSYFGWTKQPSRFLKEMNLLP